MDLSDFRDLLRQARDEDDIDSAIDAYLAANPSVDSGLLRELARDDDTTELGAATEIAAILGIRVLEFIDRDQLLAAALSYATAPHDQVRPGYWAWRALDRDTMSADELWAAVLELIDLVAGDDDALMLIGDGPLAEVESVPDYVTRIQEATRTNPGLARVREMITNEYSARRGTQH